MFKSCCACDSHNGFVFNTDVYQAARKGSNEDGLWVGVVMKLLAPLYYYNYGAYMDNFFSSVSLDKCLKGKGIMEESENEERWQPIGNTRWNRMPYLDVQ